MPQQHVCIAPFYFNQVDCVLYYIFCTSCCPPTNSKLCFPLPLLDNSDLWRFRLITQIIKKMTLSRESRVDDAVLNGGDVEQMTAEQDHPSWELQWNMVMMSWRSALRVRSHTALLGLRRCTSTGRRANLLLFHLSPDSGEGKLRWRWRVWKGEGKGKSQKLRLIYGRDTSSYVKLQTARGKKRLYR